MTEREAFLRKAKIADGFRNHEELVRAMRSIGLMDVELTDEERALLQAACQVVLKIDFLNKNERREWYDSMVDVIECHIIMSATTSESKVCYYVLLGDLHRDFSEFANGLERTELAEDALVAYEMGAKIAKSDLKPTNIFRLEIALNYSSLCIEINGLGNRAVRIAQDAIDDIANDKTLSDEELKSAENFMSILKDSLVDWKEMLGVVDEDAEEDNESGCGSDKSTSEADEAVENAVDP